MEGEDGVQAKRHEEQIWDISLLLETSKRGRRGDEEGTEGNRGAAMHVHAHHQQNQQTHYLSVFSLWSITERAPCTWRPLDTEWKREREMDEMKGNSKERWKKEGRGRRLKKEKNGFGMKGFWFWMEKPVHMWYRNMAFSNVKHKKQSCRRCRTFVTLTFVSLFGSTASAWCSLLWAKERFRTWSFVTAFIFSFSSVVFLLF